MDDPASIAMRDKLLNAIISRYWNDSSLVDYYASKNAEESRTRQRRVQRVRKIIKFFGERPEEDQVRLWRRRAFS